MALRMLRIGGVVWGISTLGLLLALLLARQSEPMPPWTLVTQSKNQQVTVYLQEHNELVPIYTSNAEFRSPTWSPDGQWIAFVDQNLHVMRYDGTDHRVLTSTFDGSPSWSPDAAYLAYVRLDFAYWNVHTIRLADGQTHQITDNFSDEITPKWSPDGEYIAFLSMRNDNWDIFSVAPDGSDLQLLSNFPEHEFNIVWRDADWLYFYLNSYDVRPFTHRVRLDDSGVPQVEQLKRNEPQFQEPNNLQSPVIDFPWHWELFALLGTSLIAMSFLPRR